MLRDTKGIKQVDLSGNLFKDSKGNIYNKYGKLVFKA